MDAGKRRRPEATFLVGERGKAGVFFKQVAMTGLVWGLEGFAAKVVDRFRLTHVITGFYTTEGEAILAPSTMRQQKRVWFTTSPTRLIRGKRVYVEEARRKAHGSPNSTPDSANLTPVKHAPVRSMFSTPQSSSSPPRPSMRHSTGRMSGVSPYAGRSPGFAATTPARSSVGAASNGGALPVSSGLRNTCVSPSTVRPVSRSPLEVVLATLPSGSAKLRFSHEEFSTPPPPPSPPESPLSNGSDRPARKSARSASTTVHRRAVSRSAGSGMNGCTARRSSRSSTTATFATSPSLKHPTTPTRKAGAAVARSHTYDGGRTRTQPRARSPRASPYRRATSIGTTAETASTRVQRRTSLTLPAESDTRLYYDEYATARIMEKHMKTLDDAPAAKPDNFPHQLYPATVTWSEYGAATVWATLDAEAGAEEGMMVAVQEDDDSVAEGLQRWRNRNRALPGDKVLLSIDPAGMRRTEVEALPLPGSPLSPQAADWSAPASDVHPGRVHRGKVKGMLERAPVRRLFAVFEHGALQAPGSAFHATLTPLSKAFPPVYVPIHSLKDYNENERQVFLVSLEDWPASSLYPHVRIEAAIGSLAFDDVVAMEEKMILTELGRLRPNTANRCLEVDDAHVPLEAARARIAELNETLDDGILTGELVDLRDSASAFTLHSGTSGTPIVAFSCSALEPPTKKSPTAKYRLGVHIADVGALVPPDGPLDDLLRERRATLALPHTLHPLLPKELRRNIGLRPGTTNRCVSVMWTVGGADDPPKITVAQTAVHIRCEVAEADLRACVNATDGKQAMLRCAIYGRCEHDNAVGLAHDVQVFAKAMEAIGAKHSPQRFTPHFRFSSLWAGCGLKMQGGVAGPALQNSPNREKEPRVRLSPAAVSARCGVENGLDHLLDDLRYAANCDVPYEKFIQQTAEHAANRMVVEFFVAARQPARILPCVCKIVAKGTHTAVNDGLPAYSLFDEYTKPVPLGKTRPLSCGFLEPYVRSWSMEGAEENTVREMDLTSPLDRYVSIVSLRMLSILLQQLKQETQNRTVINEKELVHTNEHGTVTLPARDFHIHAPTTELGIGRWRPSTLLPILRDDARHAVLRHCAYERLFDLMARHCCEYAGTPVLRLAGVVVGADARSGHVGVHLPDWGLTKWGLPLASDPVTVSLLASKGGAPQLNFVTQKPEKEQDSDAAEKKKKKKPKTREETACIGDRIYVSFIAEEGGGEGLVMQIFPPSYLQLLA